jgi:1,3-beta-glucan synthase
MCLIHIQRAVHKILISVFLSREFKHDETNRAWWTGRWYGRGLGAHVMSQPAREYIVKIIELSLWSSDLLLGHLLLFMLTPPILVPYFDRLHATLLCESRSYSARLATLTCVVVWLRPSNQIRAPLFSIKQKRQRRWIVRVISTLSIVLVSNAWIGYQIWHPICRSHRHLCRPYHSPYVACSCLCLLEN